MIIALIVIGFLLYVISSATKGNREAKRKQRHDDDMKLRLAELREQGRIEAARLLAVEKEAMRLAKEQERQAREQERQAKEQERQAEQLAKHEEMLARMQYQLDTANDEIDTVLCRIEELQRYCEYLELNRDACIRGSKEYFKWQNKLSTVEDKIYRLNQRKAKAVYLKQQAERKLSA